MFAKGNSTIKFFLGLLLGGAIGAGFALLFAPSAGEELREKIRTEAEADWQKARAEFEHGKEEMQHMFDHSKAQEDSLGEQIEGEEATE